ncbi:MAG: efflux RND transporter periplasmic adaptor subunit [Gammaproteobacteria bacterium]|nr:efflux RND transporter periplasmic adaptor subunit [Gammaproteobacteria bacterium]
MWVAYPTKFGCLIWVGLLGMFVLPYGFADEPPPGRNVASLAISVEAVSFADLAVFPRHKASAVVVPRNVSKLSAEVRANIIAVPVDVGAIVEKGSVLVMLNKAEYQLALQREQARAQSLEAKVALAQYQLQRAQKLQKQQVLAEDLLKQRETDLAVLLADTSSQKAAISQAQQNVDRCIIRAPFDAVVVEKLAYVGELASPGTPLIRIVDAQQSEVSAKLQNYQIEIAQAAKNLEFMVRDKQYSLSLRAVTPVVDSIERTQDVRLVFKAKQALPGTAGELVWQDNAPHVPAEFIVRRKTGLGIFVVNNNIAEFMLLSDAVEGRPANVSLAKDDLIVTTGRYRLGHGDRVKMR